jgi:hypothetical protein
MGPPGWPSCARWSRAAPPHRRGRPSIVRPLGALLAEQQDEWAVCRRDMSVESITKALNAPQSTDQQALAIPSAA